MHEMNGAGACGIQRTPIGWKLEAFLLSRLLTKPRVAYSVQVIGFLEHG